MTAAALLHKRRKLFFIILCVAFSAFMVDIVDLREEDPHYLLPLQQSGQQRHDRYDNYLSLRSGAGSHIVLRA